MSVIETVSVRQRGAVDFTAYYESLCALENVCPIPKIRASSKEGVIDCKCDRLRRTDWHPLLNALRINKSLKSITFHTKWQSLYLPGRNNENRNLKNGAIYQKVVTKDIAKALRSCLVATLSLTELRLQGVPLLRTDLAMLSSGLLKNKTLKEISFKGSLIGDKGTQVVCDSVKNSYTLEWLDLTACNLTCEGAAAVAGLIKHQSLRRHSIAWKDSLRQRQPIFSAMPGLKRITLNLNKEIGDRGAVELADSLRDDLWIKALDLQSCGITSDSAQYMKEILKLNTVLTIVDMRANELIDDDILDAIYEQLKINVVGTGSSSNHLTWLAVEEDNIRSTYLPPPSGLKCKSTSGKKTSPKRCSLQLHPSFSVKKCKGMPWRTAARKAERWKVLSPVTYVKKAKRERTSYQLQQESLECLQTSTPHTSPEHSPLTGPAEEKQVVKELKVQVEFFKRKYKEAVSVAFSAQERIAKLEAENMKLREEIGGKVSHIKTNEEKSVLTLEDESVLDAIESAFQQFHSFLDLLRSQGLGDLCSLLDDPSKVKELSKT